MSKLAWPLGIALTLLASTCLAQPATPPPDAAEKALLADWLAKWQANILADMRNRYCDKETGEELGWLVSPFSNGFCYGYLATGDTAWIDRFAAWTEAWTKRAVTEPDGYPGWPKADGTSTTAMPGLFTDNQLGEAMALRPAVELAAAILKRPALTARYGDQARAWIALSERVFEKWDKRGAWRGAEVGGGKVGGVWVVPPFGLDQQTGGWSAGYGNRTTDGFTLPANKQNHVARWVLAMWDATGKPIYRERAEQWFLQMKSRMKRFDGTKVAEDGKTYVWDYWDPAGPWDDKPGGGLKHWVGVHPNGGYYGIDLEGIVAAYEHKLVFTRAEIDRLIATNRDFMWNQQVAGAEFGRIDGGSADQRWKDSAGVLWTALAPYDAKLREVFEANHNPASWGGLAATPWFVATRLGKLGAGG